MGAPQLRIFYGPLDEAPADVFPDTVPMRSTVSMPLSEVLPLLAEAMAKRRGWIDDFSDDEVTVSTDLYEVLMAYQHHFHRPSA